MIINISKGETMKEYVLEQLSELMDYDESIDSVQLTIKTKGKSKPEIWIWNRLAEKEK